MTIELQKSVTGELVAFDTKKRVIVASGFDDEEDFEKWLRSFRQAADELAPTPKPERRGNNRFGR